MENWNGKWKAEMEMESWNGNGILKDESGNGRRTISAISMADTAAYAMLQLMPERSASEN